MDHQSWGRARTAKELGALVRTARNQMGFRQDELAELIEVSRMTISRMERGLDVSMRTVVDALSECGYSVLVAPKFAKIEVSQR